MTDGLSPPCGVIDGQRHCYMVRVYYEDTDLSGVVYHAGYLRWFERARSDMLSLAGIDQRRAIEQGEGGYVVAELSIRYLRPARLNDAVLITTQVEDVGAASCRLVQQAFCNDALLARAEMRIGFTGADGRAKRQPEKWRQMLVNLVCNQGGL